MNIVFLDNYSEQKEVVMSEESKGPGISEEELDKLLVEERENLQDPLTVHYGWEGKKIDGFLQRLVNLASGEVNLEVGITLTVEGTLVTGTLISAQKYFKEFAANFSGAFPGGDPEGAIRQSFEAIGEPRPGDGEFPRQFICLRNAYYVADSHHTPRGGMLWRGKLSSVSGFSLGSFTPA